MPSSLSAFADGRAAHPTLSPPSAGRGSRPRLLSPGTFETSPRSTTVGTIVFLPVKEPVYARAIERLAARRPRAQTQPDQTGDTLVSARSDQPGDGYRFILCHRRRPVRGRRHFPDCGLLCRHLGAVSLDRNQLRAVSGVRRGRGVAAGDRRDLCRSGCQQAETPAAAVSLSHQPLARRRQGQSGRAGSDRCRERYRRGDLDSAFIAGNARQPQTAERETGADAGHQGRAGRPDPDRRIIGLGGAKTTAPDTTNGSVMSGRPSEHSNGLLLIAATTILILSAQRYFQTSTPRKSHSALADSEVAGPTTLVPAISQSAQRHHP